MVRLASTTWAINAARTQEPPSSDRVCEPPMSALRATPEEGEVGVAMLEGRKRDAELGGRN